MKGLRNVQHWAIALLGFGMMTGYAPTVQAAPFEQQEIDQSRIIAIAAPVAGGSAHQLLILEQLNDTRACWQEEGDAFRTVEPLLLQFDFTGICGRSTDSNGYSLRVGGEDLGMRYSLRVLRQGSDLVLMAVPSNLRSAGGSPIEVGRTHGFSTGFSRIELDPGWRMARRMYNGQPLGHIYLTNDLSLAQLQSATSIASLPSTPTAPATSTNVPPLAGSISVETSTSGGAIPLPVISPPAATQASSVITPPIASAPSVIVGIEPSDLPTVQVNATPRSTTYQVSPSVRLSTYTGRTPFALSAAPGTAGTGTLNPGVYYRVVVSVATPSDEASVRTVVPEAFHTTVNGRSAMQVGLFRERSTAEELQQRLQSNRFNAQIIEVSLSSS